MADNNSISPSPLSPKLKTLAYTLEYEEEAVPKPSKRRQSGEYLEPPKPDVQLMRPKRRKSTHLSLAKTAVGLRELAKKIGPSHLI